MEQRSKVLLVYICVVFIVYVLICVHLSGNAQSSYVGNKNRTKPEFTTFRAAALIIIDMQLCFMNEGAASVTNALEIIPKINELIELFDVIVYSKDQHPESHISFTSNYNENAPITVTWIELTYTKEGKLCKAEGYKHPMETTDCGTDSTVYAQMLYPNHCINGSGTTELHPDLKIDLTKDNIFITKGFNKYFDSQSVFGSRGVLKATTGLENDLKKRNITRVFITGIPVEFNVAYTATDAFLKGFKSFVVLDAVEGYSKNNELWDNVMKEKGIGIQFLKTNIVKKMLDKEMYLGG